jgi:glucose dehydrogenase
MGEPGINNEGIGIVPGKIPSLLILIAILVVMVWLPGCTGPGTRPQDPVPPEISLYAGDWPLPNKDYANTRFVSTGEISSATIDRIGLKWSMNITGIGPFGGAASNPLVLGDQVLFQDAMANTYALDRATGVPRWIRWFNATLVYAPNGPGVGYGKVFVASDSHNFTALDFGDGSILWQTRVSDIPTTGMDIQPVAYDGLVYASTVPGLGDIYYAPGGTGVIFTLDQETGSRRWIFSTIDSPDLWGHPEINSGGGCWYPPAIDTATGLTFWGTGNPAPFVGTPEYPNGLSRPGPNLYTNTLLALEHRQGELVWYTQVYPHGLFDYDFQISPILTTANISGYEKDLVIGAGKMGRVYAFDRATGGILWVAVVGRHENDQLAALPPGYTTLYPGDLGGIESPMACAGGKVFAVYNDLYTKWTPVSYFAGNTTPYIPPYQDGTSGIVAIEEDTGKIAWECGFDTVNVGGATVVNDLVFTATMDGNIYALDRDTGRIVWSYRAPAGIEAWPAVAHDTIIWPCGGGLAFGGPPTLIALGL